jgi:hypothetical protein
MEILIGVAIALIAAGIIAFIKRFTKKKPKLALYTEVKNDGLSGSRDTGYYRCKIIYSIVNSGTVTAKHAQLLLRVAPYGIDIRWGLTGNGANGLPRIPTVGSYEKFAADAEQLIYPNDRLPVTATRFDIPRVSPNIKDAVIEYEISAEGAKTVKKKKTITAAELMQGVVPKR